jgi:hypothetical protein
MVLFSLVDVPFGFSRVEVPTLFFLPIGRWEYLAARVWARG